MAIVRSVLRLVGRIGRSIADTIRWAAAPAAIGSAISGGWKSPPPSIGGAVSASEGRRIGAQSTESTSADSNDQD
jgi:hypothetical protein